MEAAKEEKEKVVEDKNPPFEDLEKLFREAEMDYDQNKKNLVGESVRFDL